MPGLSVLVTGLMPISARGQGHHQSGVIGQVFLLCMPRGYAGSYVRFPVPDHHHHRDDKGPLCYQTSDRCRRTLTVLLKPDVYVFIPKGAGRSGLPHVDPLVMPVIKKQFSSVTIVYDSGIR